jgi:hypothetical protein
LKNALDKAGILLYNRVTRKTNRNEAELNIKVLSQMTLTAQLQFTAAPAAFLAHEGGLYLPEQGTMGPEFLPEVIN